MIIFENDDSLLDYTTAISPFESRYGDIKID